MNRVIPLHSLYWSIHTKDESKRETAFAFIFGVNWLWRCGVKASFGVFFHEMKYNGMTGFMESMLASWCLICYLLFDCVSMWGSRFLPLKVVNYLCVMRYLVLVRCSRSSWSFYHGWHSLGTLHPFVDYWIFALPFMTLSVSAVIFINLIERAVAVMYIHFYPDREVSVWLGRDTCHKAKYMCHVLSPNGMTRLMSWFPYCCYLYWMLLILCCQFSP